MRDELEATRSEIFDVVPFQESRQLGIAGDTENSGLGCAQSPCPRSLLLPPPSKWPGSGDREDDSKLLQVTEVRHAQNMRRHGTSG